MIKECPYCEKQLDIPGILESGRYTCPYDDCSKTFFFVKDTGILHKMEEPAEESCEDKIVIVCPNPDCRQKLRIPKTTSTLQVVCPKCSTSFRNSAQTGEAQHDISELLAEFDKALDDEIRVVKTRAGDRSLVVKDGKLVGEIAAGAVYQFSTERKVPVADETPAQIEIRGRNYRASIVRFLDFKLEVRILDFGEEEIPSAFLKIDATYVLRKLKEALSFLRSRDVDLAWKVFNRLPVRCSVREPTFTLIDKYGNLPDDFQTEAIKTCLGNEVAFVHGPPGTGKTRTLVNVVNELASNGKKVLVSCHTNIACDNIIKHFIGYDHEKTVENLLDGGGILRIGTPVLRDPPQIRALTIEAIYERLSRKLQKEKEKLTDLMESLTLKNKRYHEYKQTSIECEKVTEKIANCQENIFASKGAIKQYIKQEDELNGIISEKKQLLFIAERRNAIINAFKGTRPPNIRIALADLNYEKMEKIRIRLEEEKRLKLLLDELEKLNVSFSEKFEALPKGVRVDQIENVLRETENILEETRAKIADIHDRISELKEGILTNARVIVSTLAKTLIDPILMNMQFDAIVIDEASIAPLPMLFYTCSLAKERVLIFGDPNQLSPIKLANTLEAEKWLGRDIFQEANATQNSPHDSRIQSLNDQYRMHEEIFGLVNGNFYGELHNMRPKIDKDYHRYDGLLIPMPERRVVIIDTSNANACMSTEKTGPKSSSRYNLYHVQVIEKVLSDLVNSNNIDEKDIGIITPYRSQASFIKEAIKESELEDIEAATVHSFQGIEKKYIIFDFVEAPGGRKIGRLVNDKYKEYSDKDQSENTEARRLLTVAFSRPQEKLLIVSHNKHMLNNLPGNSVIRSIIADSINHEAIVDGSKLVPYYVPADEYPDMALFSEEELLGKEAVFNQRSFYPNLIRDLKSAQKEVVFVSGYITPNRVEKLMPYLTDLLSRGVSIRIITKPPWEQMSREKELEKLHHRLGQMGIEIYQHYGTHEKVVAIDGHILYAGSLNVLSFNNSSKEMMIRSESKSKLQKVFSVLAKTYPRLRDYLTKTGSIPPEETIVITPKRFQDILDSVRPKHRNLPETEQEAREYWRSMLKKLRWVIADDKRIPVQAILFNDTIEAMLNDPPTTVEQLLSLLEFRRNRTNIRGYENIVLRILKECREVIGKNKETPKPQENEKA